MLTPGWGQRLLLAAVPDTLTLGRELSQKALDLVVGKNDARQCLASVQPVCSQKQDTKNPGVPQVFNSSPEQSSKTFMGIQNYLAADKAKITISASNQRLLGRQRSSKGGLMRRRKVSEPKLPRPVWRLHLADMSTERVVMIVFQVF